mmetsp:Transcript_19071/g.48471  ORF Transcript_19071/g.48471 Transcript_19071/m.48471 type:complete len:98 (+) Transcript_19071:110-403(+)
MWSLKGGLKLQRPTLKTCSAAGAETGRDRTELRVPHSHQLQNLEVGAVFQQGPHTILRDARIALKIHPPQLRAALRQSDQPGISDLAVPAQVQLLQL